VVGEEHAWGTAPKDLTYLKNTRSQPWARFFRSHGLAIVVPLIARDDILGIVGFAPAASKDRLGKTQETYVKSLANIAAGAIAKGLVVSELYDVNRRLDGKIQELKTLFEVSKEFNGILDTEQLVKLLLFAIMGQVGTTKYVLLLRQLGTMNTVASRLNVELGDEVTGYLHEVAAPVIVEALTEPHNVAVRARLQDAGIEAIIPLQVQNETKGILALGPKLHGGAYAPADIEFLMSLGNLAIVSLENIRLFGDAIERQKLEDELVIAREIQRALLPSKLPEIPGFDVAAVNISSKQVGGDYYDVIALEDGKYMIAVGDVAGKGTPASLLMANLQATIRALVPIGLSLGELTRRVNDLICDNTTSGRFITFFWMILDAKSRTLRYVNAGHNPPILFRGNGDVERLHSGGIILGIIKSADPYEEGNVALDPGDSIILFTDGVTEAMNAAGSELGEEPLLRLSANRSTLNAVEMVDTLVDAVKLHSTGAPQSDDVTLVVLRAV
jgi:sigma-B regulation protein RsbU (phosphoserine phosphatase)